MTVRTPIEQATDRTRRALRELDAAAAVLGREAPLGRWIDEARQVTEGAVRVLEAHRVTALARRRARGRQGR